MSTFFSFVIIFTFSGVVFGDFLLNQKCYNLGTRIGSFFSIESCKTMIADCFKDGNLKYSKDEQINRFNMQRVSMFSDCSIKFSSGCLSSCKSNAVQNEGCGLWNHSSKLPQAGNKCQLETAQIYLTTQCNKHCLQITKNVELQYVFGKPQVEYMENFLRDSFPSTLKWMLE